MACRRRFQLVLALVSAGCADRFAGDGGGETETGDGDPGDGDPGDGDPGDGDGDPVGDGDGDGDSLLGATYLLAIETSLGPDLPLQFVLEMVDVIETNGGRTADFVLTPLSLDQGGKVPGECIGDTLVFEDVAFDLGGHFVLDMGLIMVSGEANPITGSDIEATIVLHGHTVEPDAMCGDVEGTLTSPLEYDLAGSTFAAIPLPDGCDSDPFPAPIYKCSML